MGRPNVSHVIWYKWKTQVESSGLRPSQKILPVVYSLIMFNAYILTH